MHVAQFLFLFISLLELKGVEMGLRWPSLPVCLGLKGILQARLLLLRQGHLRQTGRDSHPYDAGVCKSVLVSNGQEDGHFMRPVPVNFPRSPRAARPLSWSPYSALA